MATVRTRHWHCRTGVIGANWAVQYLASGFDVIAGY